MKEYIREYTHKVGDADSKVTSRQISMQEIKVELLGELGTYINSRVEISQGTKTKTEFKEEIIALTAGFVKVDLLQERFDGETYYLKAKLSADADDVISRINKLGKSNKESQQDKAELVKAYQDAKALRAQLAELQKNLRLAKAAGKETQSLETQYTQDAEQLSIAALYELATDYDMGRKGKRRDDNQALSWYRKAAEQGHAESQYEVGYAFRRGKVVVKDHNEALIWFHKSAEQGYVSAQYILGTIYYMGKNMNHNKAAIWFRKAAEQGHGEAQYGMGIMYREGYGVQKDENKAAIWFRKAAEQDIYSIAGIIR